MVTLTVRSPRCWNACDWLGPLVTVAPSPSVGPKNSHTYRSISTDVGIPVTVHVVTKPGTPDPGLHVIEGEKPTIEMSVA